MGGWKATALQSSCSSRATSQGKEGKLKTNKRKKQHKNKSVPARGGKQNHKRKNARETMDYRRMETPAVRVAGKRVLGLGTTSGVCPEHNTKGKGEGGKGKRRKVKEGEKIRKKRKSAAPQQRNVAGATTCKRFLQYDTRTGRRDGKARCLHACRRSLSKTNGFMKHRALWWYILKARRSGPPCGEPVPAGAGAGAGCSPAVQVAVNLGRDGFDLR